SAWSCSVVVVVLRDDVRLGARRCGHVGAGGWRGCCGGWPGWFGGCGFAAGAHAGGWYAAESVWCSGGVVVLCEHDRLGHVCGGDFGSGRGWGCCWWCWSGSEERGVVAECSVVGWWYGAELEC